MLCGKNYGEKLFLSLFFCRWVLIRYKTGEKIFNWAFEKLHTDLIRFKYVYLNTAIAHLHLWAKNKHCCSTFWVNKLNFPFSHLFMALGSLAVRNWLNYLWKQSSTDLEMGKKGTLRIIKLRWVYLFRARLVISDQINFVGQFALVQLSEVQNLEIKKVSL